MPASPTPGVGPGTGLHRDAVDRAGPGTAPTVEVHHERLPQGVLGILDIAASTMANIAPAMSFFFGYALIATTAGVAAPLTIIVGAVAIAFLGHTLSEFSRAIPSTGSFVTFIGKAFGPVVAITTSIVISAGYITAMGSVIDISGGWVQLMLEKYLNVSIPWQALTAAFVLITFWLMVSGIRISTKWAGFLFAFEMAVLLAGSFFVLVRHAGSLSAAPFNPANLTGGLKGLGLGFPLAVYMFIGWENSAALAEETADPRRNVPRAIFASIGLMGLSYLLFAYATVVGFDYNVKALGAATVPFVDMAERALPALAVFAYIAGFTSTMGAMVAGSNSQSRLIFNASREGLLPSFLARISGRSRTPFISYIAFLGIGLVLVYGFGWGVPPVTFFGDIATFGSILVALTYLVSNIALPVYYWRFQRQRFNVIRHVALPAVGVAAIGFPLWELVQPGQPDPFDKFPWIALGVIAVAVVYAVVLSRRRPGLGERVGSIVADE